MKTELRRGILETLLCCMIGVLFGAGLYWAWAREVDQLTTPNSSYVSR